MTVIKVMLLEGRIIVYSQTSSKVSNFIYSLLALFPGAISFNFASVYAEHHHSPQGEGAQLSQVLCYLRSLKEYRMPLQIFNSETLFVPLLALQDVDLFERCKGCLVGTTNPLFLNFPKAKADIAINLDKDTVDFPVDKATGSQSQTVKVARQHTSYEKKFLASIIKQLDSPSQVDELLAKNASKTITRSKTMQGPNG